VISKTSEVLKTSEVWLTGKISKNSLPASGERTEHGKPENRITKAYWEE
jgi:hypothetical protein